MSKKIISVIMSFILIISCLIPSFAASRVCNCGKNPMLVIAGFSQYDLIDSKTGEKVWGVETDDILSTVENILPSLTTLLSSNRTQADYDALCDSVIPEVNKLFDPVACTPDGEPKYNNVKIVNQFTESVANYDYDTVKEVFHNEIVDIACDAVGKDHVWVYGLDWRVDPLVLADDIHEYVERIKKETGHDKISISGLSMGGIIMASYIEKYGYDDLSNITMLSAAYTGIEMVGKLFIGDVVVDPDGLYTMITQLVGNSTVSEVLASTGILEKVIPILDELLFYSGDRVYSECLIPSFGYTTGFWAFVPDSCYEQAKQFMFPLMNEGTAEQIETLKTRIDCYHYNVQSKIDKILKDAQSNGVCVSIVSHYNTQSMPVTSASDLSGDQVIETIHTSGFATVAKLGETLNITKKAPYVSFDKIIDASTCYFPENTWFIKDLRHVAYSHSSSSDCGEFFKWILTASPDTNIYSNPKYPQFMTYDSEAKKLSVLSGADGDVNGDGRISVLDAKLTLGSICELTALTEKQAWSADTNYDGKVSISDAKNILQYIVNH